MEAELGDAIAQKQRELKAIEITVDKARARLTSVRQCEQEKSLAYEKSLAETRAELAAANHFR